MTTKILSGVYLSTYNLTSPITTLSITASGYLAGGLTASGAGTYTVINRGEVRGASYGVNLAGTGFVTNTGTIESTSTTAGAGLVLGDGGSVTNGSKSATHSLILGYSGVVVNGKAGTLANDGTIVGVEEFGVKLTDGGLVTNGGKGATHALIEGYVAIDSTLAATVFNYGTVEGVGSVSIAAYLAAGGSVTNGSATDTAARMEGAGAGVEAGGAAATVTNFGQILASGYPSYGVALTDGGVVTNGDNSDTGALIEGATAVFVTTQAGTVTNFGTLSGTLAVYLANGGTVTNGAAADTLATIEGFLGVDIVGAVGTVTNFGVIEGGYAAINSKVAATVFNYGTVEGVGSVSAAALLAAGGSVTNGSATDTAARMEGAGAGVEAAGAAATVTNFGHILASGYPSYGVAFTDGGVVTNGDNSDTGALIEGATAVFVTTQAGTVTNFGTLSGSLAAAGNYPNAGVDLAKGGMVTNGAATDTLATIEGRYGVDILGAAGTVSNFGAVGGAGAFVGAYLHQGGLVTNGGTADASALMQGQVGVWVGGHSGTVGNFGTILGALSGASAAGVELGQGGTVTNGAAALTSAFISGLVGVETNTIASDVSNFGTIEGALEGVLLDFGGQLTNGSTTDTVALVQGKYGAVISNAAGTMTNYGTMAGGAVAGGVGAWLKDGGFIYNGSSVDKTALIFGHYGVEVHTGTLVNYGTIRGNVLSTSIAVTLAAAGDVAINGSSTNAAALISGYAGVVLAAGATLTNFATVQGVGAAVNLTGPTCRLNAEAGSKFVGQVDSSGATVDVVAGVATMTGLNTSGAVVGAGTLALNGGASIFNSGASLSVAAISVSGATTSVEAAAKFAYAQTWNQTGGTLHVDGGGVMNFTGVGDTFTGTLTGLGEVAFTGGADAISNATLSATAMVVSGAAVTLSGTIALSSALTVASPVFTIAAAGATLKGGGSLNLTNLSSNAIKGASASATLTNNDRITGAGQLGDGQMVLVNQAGGVIDGNQSVALFIGTGSATIANAGIIENTAAGGTTVKSAVDNTGALEVTAGALTVNGAVTGAGTVKIGGGTADFTSTFAEKVTFTGAAGVLELAKSQSYTGSVTGFSKTGATSLDLLDIAFGGTTKATFSGTTASGTLTVTDGNHTAKITLIGNYTASTFTVASDGHGGTKVVDPRAPVGHAPPLLPLIAAMAGLGSRGAPVTVAAEPWRGAIVALAAPRVHLA